MHAAPTDYLYELNLPNGRAAHLLAMEFLLNPPDYMWKVGLAVTERIRVGLLRELAVQLAVLHQEQIVVGDMSPKNILVSLSPPRCFLLDCDAMRVSGASVLPQVETPDWRLPTGEELATSLSDRYKFGLLATRLLLSDQSAVDPNALRITRPALTPLADLVSRSLADPASRPGWEEWISALDAAIPLTSHVPPPPPAAPVGPSPVSSHAPPLIPPPPRARPAGWNAAKTFAVIAAVIAVLSLLICIVAVDGPDNGAGSTGTGSPRDNSYVDGRATAFPETPDSGTETYPQPDDTPARPATIGDVDLSTAADDPELVPVAEFLDRYFEAINGQDWNTLLTLYDPTGVIDPGDQKQRAAFIEAMSTTRNSDIRLVAVDSTATPVTARVTFVSNQSPGYGPKGRENETCTYWDVTLRLIRNGDTYRLWRPAPGASSQPC